MSESDGGGSFGFAPRGNPVRRPVRRDAVSSTPREPPEPPHSPYPPMAPAYQADEPRRLPWTWLVIGVLLGTGGTLLTSAFWFPERETSDFAGPAVIEPAPSVSSVTASTGSDEAGPEQDPGGDAADRVVVASADDERSDGPPPADGEDVATTVTTVTAGEPEPEPEPETDSAIPAGEPIIVAEDGTESDVDDASSATIEPEEAVADLLPAAPSVSEDDPVDQTVAGIPEVDTNDEPELPDVAQEPLTGPEEAVPDVSSAGPPAQVDDPADDATDARISDQPGSRQPAQEPPVERADAEPSSDDDAVELPPRIRQALRQAEDDGPELGPIKGSGNKGRVYHVQLAAVNDEAAARSYWREINERLPGVFADVEPVFDERVVDERLYLRIWVGAFDRRVAADGYCGWLKQQGQDCFVTQTDNL